MSHQERAAKPLTVVLFSGLPEMGNQGCNALTVSFMRLILEMDPEARFLFLHRLGAPLEKQIPVGRTTAKVELVNARLAPRALFTNHLLWVYLLCLVYRTIPSRRLRMRLCRMSPWVAALAGADMVATHFYGDSFSDLYGLRRLISYAAVCGTAFALGRTLVLLPQTYGPFKTRTAKRIARFVLARASHVYARDEEGMETARQLAGRGADPRAFRFCPDLAMLLEPLAPEEAGIEPALTTALNVPLVGLNVSGLLYNGGYSRDNMFGLACDYAAMVVALVKRLLADTDAHVLLVPHVFSDDVESDNLACLAVANAVPESLRSRVHLVTRQHNQNAIKGIIGECDFFIGSRMHSCIAALSQAIPAAGIAYSKKFHGVFDSVGLADNVIDARQRSADEVVSQCIACFEARDEARETLKVRVPQVQAQLRSRVQEAVAECSGRAHSAIEQGNQCSSESRT